MSYFKERVEWIKGGKKVRPKKERERIYNDVCSPCPEFKDAPLIGGQCKICKCFLHPSREKGNKLAWATTSCPDSPPRWKPWNTQEQ